MAARYITDSSRAGAIASSHRFSRAKQSRAMMRLSFAANFSAQRNLPSRLRPIWSAGIDDVLKLSAQLNASRFVTIVGAESGSGQNHSLR